MTTEMGSGEPHLSALARRTSRLLVAAALALTAGLAPPAAADDADTPGDTSGPPAERTGAVDVRRQIECLAKTIYFEARGEPDAGKLAVGHVVMNRVASTDYPNTVCGVMTQGGEDTLHRCQFSFYCDGRSDDPQDEAAWRRSQALARSVFWDFSPDPTGGARWYHADYVSPAWRDQFDQGPVIGQHVFYLDPADRGPNLVEDRPQQLAERPAAADDADADDADDEAETAQ